MNTIYLKIIHTSEIPCEAATAQTLLDSGQLVVPLSLPPLDAAPTTWAPFIIFGSHCLHQLALLQLSRMRARSLAFRIFYYHCIHEKFSFLKIFWRYSIAEDNKKVF